MGMLLGCRGPGKEWAVSSLLLLGIPRLASFPHAGHAGLVANNLATGYSLTSSVGDGDRHALDLDSIDVDGLHGLGSRSQLRSIQADDAPGWCNLWQRALFSQNCS